MARIVDGAESLLYPGKPKWGTAFSGNTITYNFMPSLPEAYLGGKILEAVTIDAGGLNVDSFKPFDKLQQNAAEEALKLWSEVADIKFKREEDVLLRLADIVDFGILDDVLNFLGLYDDFAKALDKAIGNLIGFPVVQGADIRFGTDDQGTDDQGKTFSGRAFPPPDNFLSRLNELRTDIADFIDKYLAPVIKPVEIYNKYNLLLPDIPIPSGASVVKLAKIKFDVYGDVFLSNTDSNNSPQNLGIKGADGFHTLLHEIGHALGLKHPGNYNAGGGGAPEPYLPPEKDNYKYSVMSYYQFPGHGDILPETPMLYDIAAIQILYGANNNTRSEDTTYSWNKPFVTTIWDTGGNDTISAANQSLDAVINLNAGEFSSIGSTGTIDKKKGAIIADSSVRMTDNLAIAFDVVIENAIGGTGNDILIGNNANNLLSGGDRNDNLIGAAGVDTLDGGNGIDTASYSNSGTGISINLSTSTGKYNS